MAEKKTDSVLALARELAEKLDNTLRELVRELKKETTFRRLARELHHKLAMYTVGLVFTVLALAIQSFDVTNLDLCGILLLAIFELGSWLTLFISGIFGLFWLRWAVRDYHLLADLESIGPGNATVEQTCKRETARSKAESYQNWHFNLLFTGLVVLALSRMLAVFVPLICGNANA